mmetsp:Transcript_3724/g.10761  ORF Transcript_3724/g.10761 Transcript_3724/m.10761 type:complete len:299 (+) Transcript_3724:238-1134(+)
MAWRGTHRHLSAGLSVPRDELVASVPEDLVDAAHEPLSLRWHEPAALLFIVLLPLTVPLDHQLVHELQGAHLQHAEQHRVLRCLDVHLHQAEVILLDVLSDPGAEVDGWDLHGGLLVEPGFEGRRARVLRLRARVLVERQRRVAVPHGHGAVELKRGKALPTPLGEALLVCRLDGLAPVRQRLEDHHVVGGGVPPGRVELLLEGHRLDVAGIFLHRRVGEQSQRVAVATSGVDIDILRVSHRCPHDYQSQHQQQRRTNQWRHRDGDSHIQNRSARQKGWLAPGNGKDPGLKGCRRQIP